MTFAVSNPVGPPSNAECVTYTILDDNMLEGDHEFVSEIIAAAGASIGAQSTTTVTITDDEREYTYI